MTRRRRYSLRTSRRSWHDLVCSIVWQHRAPGVLRLLARAALRLLVRAALQLLARAALRLLVRAVLRLLVRAALRLLVQAVLRLLARAALCLNPLLRLASLVPVRRRRAEALLDRLRLLASHAWRHHPAALHDAAWSDHSQRATRQADRLSRRALAPRVRARACSTTTERHASPRHRSALRSCARSSARRAASARRERQPHCINNHTTHCNCSNTRRITRMNRPNHRCIHDRV